MTIPAPAPAGSHRAHIQARMRELQFKMLDVADGILDSLQAKREAAPALPLAVARRQTVNLLGVPTLCERGRCRRTKLCHGEPAHCLTVSLRETAAPQPPPISRCRISFTG